MRGTQTRFSTEYLSHTQDADGVDVRVLDRLTGVEYTIRAKYLIGADGARVQGRRGHRPAVSRGRWTSPGR